MATLPDLRPDTVADAAEMSGRTDGQLRRDNGLDGLTEELVDVVRNPSGYDQAVDDSDEGGGLTPEE